MAFEGFGAAKKQQWIDEVSATRDKIVALSDANNASVIANLNKFITYLTDVVDPTLQYGYEGSTNTHTTLTSDGTTGTIPSFTEWKVSHP